MGSIYATKGGAGGGGGSPYATPSGPTVASAPSPAKHHRGLLGDIAHVFAQGGLDIYNAAVSSPSGFYHAGAALDKDIADYLHGRVPQGAFLHQVIVPSGQSIAQSAQHPLRHPGLTLLNALALAAPVAKAGELGLVGGRALAAGEGVGGARAALLAARTRPLTLTAGGVSVKIPAARPALTRYVQQSINFLRNRFPEAPIGLQSQVTRVGKALGKQRQFEYRTQTAPAVTLRALGRKINWKSPEGVAMRAVAEGTTLEERIAAHQADLATARTRYARQSLKRQISLAEQAKQYVMNVPDASGRLVPTITDPKLAARYAKAEEVASLIDQRAIEAGLMSPGTAAAAIQKPGQLILGGKFDEATGQIIGGPEDFQSGRIHVGYYRRPKLFSSQQPPVIGSADTMAIPRQPPRFSHQLTGAVFHQGAFRNDVPTLIAENMLETERYLAIIRARDFFIEHAQDTPVGVRHPVAIRLQSLAHDPFPQFVQDYQAAVRAGRQAERPNLLGMHYDEFRKELFPPIKADEVGVHPGVKWIDGRLLGGLNKPNPLATVLQHTEGKIAVGTLDLINNAERMAILYLKPAYAAPNIMGNAFLTLTQQGFAAPFNLARAARIAHKLKTGDLQLIESHMQEGISGALHGAGLASNLVNRAASVWGNVVDKPFRLASFMYEARKALRMRPGVTDWQQIGRLLHEPAMREQLASVTERANRALIDYTDLNRWEQAIVRRVLFFYPWLKGSTKYAATYVREHPVQAGLLGQLGEQGRQATARELGPLPSWAQGYFRVGGTNELPLVVNPTAAGVLSQPAQLAATATSFFSPHVKPGYALANLLTPSLAGALAALAGYDTFRGQPVEPNYLTAIRSLTGGLPGLTLYHRLTQDQRNRLFPLSPVQALEQFVGGGVVPKPAVRAKLTQSAIKERKKRR